ncbi:MAG: hypothetical protein Wins2KO_31810 [Winogradskyella sp.]
MFDYYKRENTGEGHLTSAKPMKSMEREGREDGPKQTNILSEWGFWYDTERTIRVVLDQFGTDKSLLTIITFFAL